MARELVRIDGLSDLQKALEELPVELVSKNGGVVLAALRKAARAIRDEARANVDRIVAEQNIGGRPSKSTGALRDSIGVKRRKLESGNGERVQVGIFPLSKKLAATKLNRRKQKVGQEYQVLPPTYYGWFLELGTERQSPKPFMSPAFEKLKGSSVVVFRDEIAKRIKRIEKKYPGSRRPRG